MRGPGIKHQFEDSGDDYEMDLNHNGRGRIIFLGDGKEGLVDGNHEDEDKDVEMNTIDTEPSGADESRREREETPGPESHKEQQNHDPMDTEQRSEISQTNEGKTDGPSAIAPMKAIPETALPDKLVTPAEI